MLGVMVNQGNVFLDAPIALRVISKLSLFRPHAEGFLPHGILHRPEDPTEARRPLIVASPACLNDVRWTVLDADKVCSS